MKKSAPLSAVKAAATGAFTGAGVRRGFGAGQVLAPGTLLYAVVFGVLASECGLAWLQALAMSVFVYSGSAQLAVLQAAVSGAATVAVCRRLLS